MKKLKPDERKISLGVSFDRLTYAALQTLAVADRRSISFLIRDAAEELLARRTGDGTRGGTMLAELKNGKAYNSAKVAEVLAGLSLSDKLDAAAERLETWKLEQKVETEKSISQSRRSHKNKEVEQKVTGRS